MVYMVVGSCCIKLSPLMSVSFVLHNSFFLVKFYMKITVALDAGCETFSPYEQLV